MAAPEKTAIRTSTRPLVDGLSEEDIESIADDLRDNNLISSDVYQGIFSYQNKDTESQRCGQQCDWESECKR